MQVVRNYRCKNWLHSWIKTLQQLCNHATSKPTSARLESNIVAL